MMSLAKKREEEAAENPDASRYGHTPEKLHDERILLARFAATESHDENLHGASGGYPEPTGEVQWMGSRRAMVRGVRDCVSHDAHVRWSQLACKDGGQLIAQKIKSHRTIVAG